MAHMLRTAGLAASLMLSCGLPGFAWAAPMVLGPTYVEPVRDADHPAPPDGGGCAIQVLEIRDVRRAPEIFGSVLNFQAFHGPDDREAWLRSIFDVGLKARGFNVTTLNDGARTPVSGGQVAIRAQLQSVWIGIQGMNKVGSVVLRIRSGPGGGSAGTERIYRGDKTSVNMWGSQKEFNGLLNDIVALALDDLATDLHPMCKPTAGTN